jgi:hypothetical protein
MQNTIDKQDTPLTPPVGDQDPKKYKAPRIDWIPLDNEISLALESSPPIGPSETLNSIQNPFKQNTGLV